MPPKPHKAFSRAPCFYTKKKKPFKSTLNKMVVDVFNLNPKGKQKP